MMKTVTTTEVVAVTLYGQPIRIFTAKDLDAWFRPDAKRSVVVSVLH